ncbi:MAG: hypothetical protein RR555_05490 [Bacteroidales bacterium]
MQIRFSINEIEKLGLTIKQLSDTVNIAKKDAKFLKFVGQLLVSRAKTNLEEGGYNGKSYNLLAVGTQKQKSRQGYSLKPLQRTGLLKRSLNSTIEEDELKLRGLDIAKHHQYGAPKANIPPRPIYIQDKEDMDDVRDFLIRRFKQQIPEVK